MTSPVERISGPRSSAPGKRSAGKIASFAPAPVPPPPRGARGAGRRGGTERRETLAQHEPAGVLDERDPGRLGDERHRARRARVRLEDVELAFLEAELEVEQCARAEAGGERRRERSDLGLERRRDRRGRGG